MFRRMIVLFLVLVPTVGLGCQKKTPAPAPAPVTEPATSPAPVAKEPASVSDIQQKLVEDGAKLRVDGVMGQRTKAALKKFQKKNGLTVTGEADEETLGKLGLN